MTGNELKRWREKQGLTQVTLAEKLDRSERQIRSYEKMKKIPKSIGLAVSALTRSFPEEAPT